MLMNKFIFIFVFLTSLLLLGCETVKKKTDAIVERDTLELSKYIGKSLEALKVDLGQTDEDFRNEKGNFELLYKTKKYGIPCERRFELNSDLIVIGFVSKGCF